MDLPFAAEATGTGVLLLSTSADAATAWVRRGLVRAALYEFGPWIALTPVSAESMVAAPYDDGLLALAARPVGGKLRPAIGFYCVGGKAAVSLRHPGWRSVQRWLYWDPHHGVRRLPQSTPVRPHDLAKIAVPAPSPADLGELFTRRGCPPLTWLEDLMSVLKLPGAALLHGPSPSGTVIEPDPRSIERFQRLTRTDDDYDELIQAPTGAPSSAPSDASRTESQGERP